MSRILDQKPVSGRDLDLQAALQAAGLPIDDLEQRGRGYGEAVTRRMLDQAGGDGTGTVYLLTEPASAFFKHLRFAMVDRATAPVNRSKDWHKRGPGVRSPTSTIKRA